MSNFSPQALFADGILDSDPGKVIGTFAQHHYSGLVHVVCRKGFQG
jgi:hypothetical protein